VILIYLFSSAFLHSVSAGFLSIILYISHTFSQWAQLLTICFCSRYLWCRVLKVGAYWSRLRVFRGRAGIDKFCCKDYQRLRLLHGE